MQYVLQLVSSRNGVVHSMGTAIIIQDGLALTAAHIIHACERAYGWKDSGAGTREADFMLYACQYVSESSVHRFVVDRFFVMESADLAILRLRGGADWLPPAYLKWTLIPPVMGERMSAFAFAGTVDSGDFPPLVHSNPFTSVGRVTMVYPRGRDSVIAPFPCFSTNARYDDSMSGGPVINDEGRLCGIICSNLPPSQPGEEHSSLVSLLWPVWGLEVEVHRIGRPGPEKCRMIDLKPTTADSIKGFERLIVDGQKIAYWYEGEEPSRDLMRDSAPGRRAQQV